MIPTANVIITTNNTGMEVFKRGTLCFWGEWFGRPMDNFHTVVDAQYDKSVNTLTLLFDQGEKCTVYNPDGIVNEQKQFHITDADKIVWEWYHYGKEKIPENLYRKTYTKISKCEILAEYDTLWEQGQKVFNPSKNFALKIC